MADERTSKARLAELSTALDAEKELRRRAEQALRESEGRWRALAGTISDSILIVDRGDTIEFLNRAAPGLAIDKVIGTSVFDYLQPESHRTIRDAFAQVLQSGEPVPADVPGVGGDGTRARHPGRVGPVTRDGEVVGFIIVSGALADRPRSGESMLATEEFLTGLLEHAPTPIDATAIDGRRLLVNRAWEELWRLSREEVIGLVWEERLPPAQARRFQDQNRQVIDTAAPLVLEEEVETPDGRHLSLHTVKFPVRDADGRIGAVGVISFDISERKRAEATLVEWTNRYEAAVQATGQILYDWDTASDVVLFGGNCEAILGYSPESLSGGLDRWVELIHPEDRADFMAEIERVRSTKRAFDMDYRVRRQDGGYITVRDVGRYFLNPDGTPARMVGFVADITERRRMEEALGEGQATLRTFYDSAPLGMGVVEIHGEDILFVSTNQATADLLGVSTESLQNRYVSQVGFSSELLADWIGHYRESGRLGGPVRFEYDTVWHGERRWAASTVSPIPGGRAGRERFAFVVEEITERKRTEETLARDALLLANVRDSVIVTDLEGIVTYWNEGATWLFGWRAEERLGRPLVEMVPETARARMLEATGAIHNGKEFSGEWEHYRKDGSRVWIDARATRFADASGRPVGVIGVAHDITGRKRTEEALRESAARLQVLSRRVVEVPIPSNCLVEKEASRQDGFATTPFWSGGCDHRHQQGGRRLRELAHS